MENEGGGGGQLIPSPKLHWIWKKETNKLTMTTHDENSIQTSVESDMIPCKDTIKSVVQEEVKVESMSLTETCSHDNSTSTGSAWKRATVEKAEEKCVHL